MAATLVGSWATYTSGSLPSGSAAPGAGSNRKYVHILLMEKTAEQTVTSFTVGGETYDEIHNVYLSSGGSNNLQIIAFIWNEATIAAMVGSTISFTGISSGSGVNWSYATIQDCDQSATPWNTSTSLSTDSLPVSVSSVANDYVVGGMLVGSANRAPLTDDVLTEIDEYSVSAYASRLSAGVGGDSTITFESDKVANNTMAVGVLVFQDPSSGPLLTLPTDEATGATTAALSVTTDTGTGDMYWVVTQSATTPSHAQIVAGTDHLGAAADDFGDSIVSGGLESFSSTGLTASTQYYAHFAQDAVIDAVPVSGDGFVTSGSTPTLSLPTALKTGSSTASGTVTSDTNGGAIAGVITTSATTPTSVQILAGQDHLGASAVATDSSTSSVGVNNFTFTGLAPSTVYYAHYAQDGTVPATPLSSASITTDANAAPVLDTPIADQVCVIGVPFGPLDVSGNFSDPDGDTLTYSASGLPVGLTIDPNTGIISGTPTGGYNP